MENRRAVAAFFGKHGFDYGGLNVESLTDSILGEMEAGLAGGASSLDMIPTWTTPPACRPRNTQVIAIDAGGTNLRSSLVTFDGEGRAEITRAEKTAMPATDRTLTKAEFFDALAARLERLKDASPRIGFCFSYAMAITPEEDGRVILFSKEIKAPEVMGSLVGAGLLAALKDRGWKPVEKITLINDTKAALLSGAAGRRQGAEYSSFVGFILGTGLNSAYIENGVIPKAAKIDRPAVMPKSQIVVCETGKFAPVPRSGFDRILDSETATPGFYLLEKMCSGAYLGRLASIILGAAAEEGLFSPSAAKALSSVNLSLRDMDRFLWSPWDKTGALGGAAALGKDSDYAVIYTLLDALVDRTARIAAAVIGSSVIKSGEGGNPARPVCVTIEGTTALKTHHLREKIFAYTSRLLRRRGRSFEIVTLEDAITLGAAIAACANPL